MLTSRVILPSVPGRSARRNLTRSTVIRRKLWEVYAGLTGLAMSVVMAFFITQGLKNASSEEKEDFAKI